MSHVTGTSPAEVLITMEAISRSLESRNCNEVVVSIKAHQLPVKPIYDFFDIISQRFEIQGSTSRKGRLFKVDRPIEIHMTNDEFIYD